MGWPQMISIGWLEGPAGCKFPKNVLRSPLEDGRGMKTRVILEQGSLPQMWREGQGERHREFSGAGLQFVEE